MLTNKNYPESEFSKIVEDGVTVLVDGDPLQLGDLLLDQQ